jgi:ParB-like chromosome segregation protein Spo0J
VEKAKNKNQTLSPRTTRLRESLRFAPVETVDVAKLLDAPYNPRRKLAPGDPEYEKLKRSMGTFGLADPPVWNRTTGHVVGGHQRIEVLRREFPETTAIPVAVVELDLEREKALNVALNKIEGSWDEDGLARLLDELRDSAIDETVTGFDTLEIDAILAEFAEARSDDQPEAEAFKVEGHYTVVADCLDAGQQGEVMAMLRKKKVACHSVTRE